MTFYTSKVLDVQVFRRTAVLTPVFRLSTLLNGVSSATIQETTSSPYVFPVMDADIELNCRNCRREQSLFRNSKETLRTKASIGRKSAFRPSSIKPLPLNLLRWLPNHQGRALYPRELTRPLLRQLFQTCPHAWIRGVVVPHNDARGT
jgi:hypothetical protein